MSEEGEAEFDASQIGDSTKVSVQTAAHDAAAGSATFDADVEKNKQRISSSSSSTSKNKAENSRSDYIPSQSLGTASEHAGSAAMAASGDKRSDYDARNQSKGHPRSPTWSGSYSGRAEDTGRYAAGNSSLRSRSRSRSREYERRAAYETGHYEGSSRRSEYRSAESEYHSSSYRQSRYPDSSRSNYSRRYEREPPRYRHRDSARGGYSRAPGYGGFRDDLSEDDNMRRDIDKERAIEELRLRVRATTERPVTPRDRSRSATRASYAIPPPASTVKPDMPSKSRGTLGVGSDNTGANLSSPAPLAASVVAPAATSETATVTKGDTSVAPEVGNSVSTAGATAINMDDIEEGEHIEGEVEKPVSSRYTRRSTDGASRRSRSPAHYYSRGRGDREPSPTAGRSRSRVYYSSSQATYDNESRRAGSHRDYQTGADSISYRRRHEDYPDRREYRSRGDTYGGGNSGRPSAHPSRYADSGSTAYTSSRHSGARSPEPHGADDSSYRSGRRTYSSRYDRHYPDTSEPHAEARQRQQPRSPLSRPRSKSRSRSPPSLTSLHVSHQEDRRSRRPSYGDRSRDYASRPISRSRSPRHHSRSMATEGPANGSDYTNPPPPPPPTLHASSSHVQVPGSSGTLREESPYRGYPPSRSYRRSSRTPKIGTHGRSHSRTPYGASGSVAGRHEYEGTHSRESSVGAQYYSGSVGAGDSNTGMGGGYRSSRVHSPDITMQQQQQQQRDVLPPPPPPPELILPPLVHGTDLFIARMPEAEEWIEAREKAREQAKRILETSANARRTAFDLVHVGWNVLKADSQVQLAVWQLERAEGGLGLADRSLLETEGIGEI